ncbi:MAG: SET domain-containing protein-lysine N-methyltransferase [Promethearchaeota archaeon]
MKYQSDVNTCFYGKCLIATEDLSPNIVVEKLEGYYVQKGEIPPDEICHAILVDKGMWMVIQTNARYINHSCSPNCYINDNLEIITKLTIKKGEELTICYNIVHNGENPGQWDDKWSFLCLCGSKNCQGIINKYITEDGLMYIAPVNEGFKNQIEVQNISIEY